MSVESYYTSLENPSWKRPLLRRPFTSPILPNTTKPPPCTTPWSITTALWKYYIEFLNPFPIHRALLAMEDHLYSSLQLPQTRSTGHNYYKVLDAGCGNGDTAIYFAKKGNLHMHAIDLLPEKVAIARRNVEGELGRAYKTGASTSIKPGETDAAVKALEALSVQEGDYHDLRSTFEDNTFDAVYTIETLAHAINLPVVLCGFHRVLKPGGRLVLYEYDHWAEQAAGSHDDDDDDAAGNQAMEKVHRYGGISPQAGHHHVNGIANDPRSKTEAGLVKMVEEAGLSQTHETDLTRNVRPLLRFLVICCFIPYVIVSVLGLEAWFINTVAVVVNYRRGWRYVAITARKP